MKLREKKMKDKDVFVTRDSCFDCVTIFPATVGIRKFHGCIAWGAAWNKDINTHRLSRNGVRYAKYLSPHNCRDRFGFSPRPGTAYLIEYTPTGRMRKPQKVDIDFTN